MFHFQDFYFNCLFAPSLLLFSLFGSWKLQARIFHVTCILAWHGYQSCTALKGVNKKEGRGFTCLLDPISVFLLLSLFCLSLFCFNHIMRLLFRQKGKQTKFNPLLRICMCYYCF
ncbi:hypothetical protein BDV23DRAFT_64039 [Aspergillus alliaceus]|uniref:Uncharacterized protein n=1 Tax=Petromyces alliaceus TaxID=209559 RepID=A0A5N7CCH4_PETAA|nr:hypothetical protein BDV23DRAFT_64039 [Aspergillus alliaceus]